MSDEVPDVYGRWLSKYSAAKDPVEALVAVQKEVELLLRVERPPLEVRVAALEGFVAIWTDFLVSMLFIEGMMSVPPDMVIERATVSAEFIRLASLSEAIQLDRIANPKGKKE